MQLATSQAAATRARVRARGGRDTPVSGAMRLVATRVAGRRAPALGAWAGPERIARRFPALEARSPRLDVVAGPAGPSQGGVDCAPKGADGRESGGPGGRLALGRGIKRPGDWYNPGSRLPAPGSRLPAPGSRLPAPGSRLPAPGSRLPAPGSRLPAPGSRLPAPGSLYLLWEDPCPPAPTRASGAHANLRPHPTPCRAHAQPPSHRQRGSSVHSSQPCRRTTRQPARRARAIVSGCANNSRWLVF